MDDTRHDVESAVATSAGESCVISGPLRADDRLKTNADPDGVTVDGMLNNCAGGKTPSGTVLTCEENFDQYFGGYVEADDVEDINALIAPPSGTSDRSWENEYPRFDLTGADAGGFPKLNEYHKFGYVVEIDPYDPGFVPRKRTALGRFKHEGAQGRVAANGRYVTYSGDDARFEFIYRFVSDGTFSPTNRAHNLTLLDSGKLFVATLNDDGSGEWLELNPATTGFADQNTVLLRTRAAGRAVGATEMDRPEDIDVSPVTGKVYVALTNNSARTTPDAGNPRAPNPHGHILEIIEDGDDPTGTTFTWELLVLCGDPAQADDTLFGPHLSLADGTNPDAVAAGVDRIADPDNLAFDDDGNLWISTDGMPFEASFNALGGRGQNDSVFSCAVEGPERGLVKLFASGPNECEMCGPEFSGDNRTFFIAPQHPGQGGGVSNTISSWPTGIVNGVPGQAKAAVVAIRHLYRRKIGAT